MMKVDLSDGFYRVNLNIDDIPKLGVAFPAKPGEEQLVAFPLVLSMGWKNSPPIFSTVTETIADVANQEIKSPTAPRPHPLDDAAAAVDAPSPWGEKKQCEAECPFADTRLKDRSVPSTPGRCGGVSHHRHPIPCFVASPGKTGVSQRHPEGVAECPSDTRSPAPASEPQTVLHNQKGPGGALQWNAKGHPSTGKGSAPAMGASTPGGVGPIARRAMAEW